MRLAFLIFIFTSLYLSLGVQAYDLQVKNGELFHAKAQSQLGAPKHQRGAIFITDRENSEIPIAIDKKSPIIYAVPKEIVDPQEYAALLAQMLDLDSDELYQMFQKRDDPYELLVKSPSEEQLAVVNREHIRGIYIGERHERFYPLKNLAAHIVGFARKNEEDKPAEGQYGAESFYNTLLVGAGGESTAIHLTIDQHIQAQGEKILRALVANTTADGGSFIVQDPETGSILAMGSLPDFDPNEYGAFPLQNFLNPVTQAIYEPGSVFKIFTMAAGIETGHITPDTTYEDTGSVTINGETIRNWDRKAHGIQTMVGVLERSLNMGAVFVQQKIGKEMFLEYVKKFGIGRTTGIGLPGEVAGSIRPLIQDVQDINYATASFGQGISATPIELVSAISAIANDGIFMRPRINAGIPPQSVQTIVSPETAHAVTEMLVSAVDAAYIMHISGYAIAGKTGTAQIPDLVNGGYTDNVINTYAGYLPARDPQVTIFIKLDNPADAPLSRLTVVPAFRELAEFVINYLQIPPDRIEE